MVYELITDLHNNFNSKHRCEEVVKYLQHLTDGYNNKLIKLTYITQYATSN